MLNPDLNIFTQTETWAAADELGLILTEEEVRAIAFLVVTSKFPGCIREHLQSYSRRFTGKSPPTE